jgi:hypothetical protein
MVMAFPRALFLVALLVACDRGDPPPGLPPASEWKPPEPKPARVEGTRRGGKRAARGSASHRLDVEAKQGAALADEEDEGAAEPDEDPHGADPGHGEEAAEELEEERGPRQTLARGQIRATGEAASAVKPGAVIYVSAVPIDSSSGQATGSAIAVDRFEVTSVPMPFELAASAYEGEVVITAWTDGDGEARTREPGDAEGRVRARLPADKVDLVLDRVLK